MADEDWEARMAARARERWVHQRVQDDAEWRAEWAAKHRAEMLRLATTMPLSEALRLLNLEPWACACIGPPGCCMDRYATARALKRAAHIAVKLIVSRMEALTDG